jgi:hypothetical protein
MAGELATDDKARMTYRIMVLKESGLAKSDLEVVAASGHPQNQRAAMVMDHGATDAEHSAYYDELWKLDAAALRDQYEELAMRNQQEA